MSVLNSFGGISFGRKSYRGVAGLLVVGMLTLALIDTSSASTNTTTPRHGGTLDVLEMATVSGNWPAGFDPLQGDGEATEMDAIYGGLFEWGSNNKEDPDLASSYSFTDHDRTLTLHIRPDVTFQDGTPFNASAVAWNFRRDFNPANACTCLASFPVQSISTPNKLTVVLKLTRPDPAVIASFLGSNPNYIASPTAFRRLGEPAFTFKPVGAGPFEVVTDVTSTELVLKRFPKYWEAGHPYLNHLVFKSVASDEDAYEDMLAGDGNAYEDLSTVSFVPIMKRKFRVTALASTTPYTLALNETKAPFNDKLAREAMYYATNVRELDKTLFRGLNTIVEGITGPGGLFYNQTVPGYRTYNLAKARAIVKQLGGISFELAVPDHDPFPTLGEALLKEYQAAGMTVSFTEDDPATEEQADEQDDWQSQLRTIGAYDPASGFGIAFRTYSTSIYSGIHSIHLDQLENEAAAAVQSSVRQKLYNEISDYLSEQADEPMMFTQDLFNVSKKEVQGPGFTTPLDGISTVSETPWEDVWLTNG